MDSRSSCLFSLSLPLHGDDRCYNLSQEKWHVTSLKMTLVHSVHSIKFFVTNRESFITSHILIYVLFDFVFHQGTLSDAWQEGNGRVGIFGYFWICVKRDVT